MIELFYNKETNEVLPIENKGNNIFYDIFNKVYIEKCKLLTLEECYKIFANKDLEKLILKYK